MRERLTIEEEVVTAANAQGGYDTTWQPLGGVGAAGSVIAAEVLGVSGTEGLHDRVERSINRWRVTIRRDDRVTVKHRFQWLQRDGSHKLLEIKSVMQHPDTPREAMLLLCESGA